MAASITIPAIGPVDKRIVIGIGGAAAAYVGYQYFKSRNAASATATDSSSTDSQFADGGTIPSVSGAVSPDNNYGSGSSTPPSSTDYGFTGTTNSEWTQYATTQLEQSETWSYTDIVSALGNFISSKPLTTLQQQIVQAAIAVAGYPPVGTHTIIPGGDTAVLIAPTGVRVTPTGTTTVSISWNEVPGAAGYYLYRSGSSVEAGAGVGTHASMGGLQPDTTYSFSVAAHSASGKIGPRSASVSAKTLTPSGPTVFKPPTAIHES